MSKHGLEWFYSQLLVVCHQRFALLSASANPTELADRSPRSTVSASSLSFHDRCSTQAPINEDVNNADTVFRT